MDATAFTDEATYRHTRPTVSRARTLIPDAYTSRAFFDIERDRVIATSWVAVGTTGEVAEPGQVILAEVAGRPVIVTRNEHGRLRAFHNVCRHRGTMLLDGVGTVGQNLKIRCPYHSWTYDLDGRCLATPLFAGSEPEASEFDRADYGLLAVQVDSWGFLVFVNLDPHASPLAEQLGDLPERLRDYQLADWRAVRRRRYEIAANYKLIAENFMEYYHLPWVHPELAHVSRIQDHYQWQGNGMYTGMCTTPISANTDAGGWQGLPAVPGLTDADSDAGRFIWLFPNTAVAVLPNHAFVLLTQPTHPDHTIEQAVLLAHPDCTQGSGATKQLDQLERFWDLVNTQDQEIVERVQKGIANPAYQGGPMCYRFEEPLHRFQNMIIDRMVGIQPGAELIG